VTSFVLHAILWTDFPLLSNDVFRYIWDGTLLHNGINPLAFAPNDPTLLEIAAHFPYALDHRGVPSVYPPISLLYFYLVTAISVHPIAFCICATLLNVVSVCLLALTLRRSGRPASGALIFAWHPLLLLECGYGGHVDALGFLFISLSCFSVSTFAKPAWIAAAGLVKLWPISLLSLQVTKKRTFLISFLLFAVPSILLWWHAHDVKGLSIYAQQWEFNGSLYSILKAFLNNGDYARWICAALFLATLPFLKDGLNIVGAFLLCSPVVYPWYAAWLLPFLVFQPRIEWLFFTLAVVASYAVVPEYLTDRVWIEPLWPRFLAYLPLYGILGFQLIRSIRSRLSQPAMKVR
jgi:alpha-1,6-mannosyltransferase